MIDSHIYTKKMLSAHKKRRAATCAVISAHRKQLMWKITLILEIFDIRTPDFTLSKVLLTHLSECPAAT